MNTKKISEILGLHKRFLSGGKDGKRADLSGADLSGANLRWANLRWANLSGADLSEADLSGANLSGADGIILFGPVGDASRMGYAVCGGAETIIHLGCNSANLSDTLAAIAKKYGPDSPYAALVTAAVRELESRAARAETGA